MADSLPTFFASFAHVPLLDAVHFAFDLPSRVSAPR